MTYLQHLPVFHTAARPAYLQALGEGGVDIRGRLKSCQLSEGGIGVINIQVQRGPPTSTPEGSGGQALQRAWATV